MRKLIILVLALVIGYPLSRYLEAQHAPASTPTAPVSSNAGDVERAFADQRSNVQVQIQGTVSKLLKDDDEGSRHQRFIVRLASGHTVRVAHNVDLAPRVEGIRSGDAVTIYGEYEWNDKGGVIHWTHRDPQGRHAAGWIIHAGRKYQ
jgi:Protein of unknown function (DUF3465)